MIAEVIPGAYDAEGKKVYRPFDRHRGLRPTFPLGRYVSQPLRGQTQPVRGLSFLEIRVKGRVARPPRIR